jgi:CubicO group peptidase (beta-lactamase class C family)
LVGDVLDVAEFLRLHLNDGTLNGHRVLSADSARSMRVVNRPGKPFDHGQGWFREPPRRRTRNAGDTRRVEHYGAGAGFWNVARLHPDKGIAIALMTNSTTRPALEPTLTLLASAAYR